jgi:hypothetical protein
MFPFLTKVAVYRQILVKVCNKKFHENPSSGNRGVLSRQNDLRDMTKLTVACRKLAKAPKILPPIYIIVTAVFFIITPPTCFDPAA